MNEKVYDEKTCCICLNDLGNVDVVILQCGHKCFHASCFVNAQISSGRPVTNCPICRSVVIEIQPAISPLNVSENLRPRSERFCLTRLGNICGAFISTFILIGLVIFVFFLIQYSRNG